MTESGGGGIYYMPLKISNFKIKIVTGVEHTQGILFLFSDWSGTLNKELFLVCRLYSKIGMMMMIHAVSVIGEVCIVPFIVHRGVDLGPGHFWRVMSTGSSYYCRIAAYD